VDLQVIQLRQVLSITRMVEVPGPPHLLYVYGPPTDQVTDVEVNGRRGYSFTTQGDAVVVTLPNLMVVRTIAVLGRIMGGVKEAAVVHGFPPHPGLLSGMQLLVQMFIKELLTTPGSDVFSPGSGGGARKIVGSKVISNADLTTSIALALQRTAAAIQKKQAGNLTIPRPERLLSATLIRAQVSPGDESVTVDVELRNQAGVVVRVGLG